MHARLLRLVRSANQSILTAFSFSAVLSTTVSHLNPPHCLPTLTPESVGFAFQLPYSFKAHFEIHPCNAFKACPLSQVLISSALLTKLCGSVLGQPCPTVPSMGILYMAQMALRRLRECCIRSFTVLSSANVLISKSTPMVKKRNQT